MEMARLKQAWRNIRKFFGGDFFERWRRVKTIVVEDLPKTLASRRLYIQESGGVAWAAAMRCPGGCGYILHMNLMEDEDPFWKLEKHFDKTVSLRPSIWRKEGCHCHFFLTRGKILWV
jgi:hypothetical protein